MIENRPYDQTMHDRLKDSMVALARLRAQINSSDRVVRATVHQSLSVAAIFQKMAVGHTPKNRADLLEGRVYEILNLLKIHAQHTAFTTQRISAYLEQMLDLFPEAGWRKKLIGEIQQRRADMMIMRQGVAQSESIFSSGNVIFHDPEAIIRSLHAIDDARDNVNTTWHKAIVTRPQHHLDALAPRVEYAAAWLGDLSKFQLEMVKAQGRIAEKCLLLVAARSTIPDCNENDVSGRMRDYSALAGYMLVEMKRLLDGNEHNARATYASRDFGRPFFQPQ